ncbi:MAG: hypothetical protein KDK27_06215, partial [Leptospiraceae bacterium]|nr:hypothetical protein [Leptospiraceae bacterium]
MLANNEHTNRLQYVHYIPPAWRALAVLGYLSEILDFGFLLPVAIWFVFRHNRFLRMHALAAGSLHLAGFLISLLVRIPSHFFLLEFTQFFVTPQQFLGMITGSDQASVGMFLFLTSGGFIMTLLPVLGQSAVQRPGNRHRVSASELLMHALIALPVTPLLFYTDFLWGNTGQSGGGIFHLYRFQNPYNMFPGHVIALWCVTLAIGALRGRVPVFTPLSGFFMRLIRAEHATGERLFRAASRRSYVLPGWGELFSGRPAGGLIVACLFLLVLMFAWISLGLNYGRLVEGIPFLNVNFTWFFLSELGLRTHLLPDKDFRNLFGRPLVLAVLTVMLAAIYAYSQWNVRMLHGRTRARPFVLTLAHSVLLHLTPVSILLLIPVMVSPFLQQPSGAEQTEEQELEFYIPESYDASRE